MLLLMDQQPSTEDATLHQKFDDEDEELEHSDQYPDQHPDPDYEYVYPGSPKRYDSARKASEDEPEDSHDAEDIDKIE